MKKSDFRQLIEDYARLKANPEYGSGSPKSLRLILEASEVMNKVDAVLNNLVSGKETLEKDED